MSNEGLNSKFAILIFDNPFFTSSAFSSGCSSSVSSSPSLVTFIVYVFVVPSSAVTTTFKAFAPFWSVFVPVPDIVAPESCAVAYTSTLSTSSGTVTLYVVVPGLNPEKSFGLIPRLLKFALLDSFDVVDVPDVLPLDVEPVLEELLDDELPLLEAPIEIEAPAGLTTTSVPAFDILPFSAVAVIAVLPELPTVTVKLCEPPSIQTLSVDKVPFEEERFTLPIQSEDIVPEIVSPALAVVLFNEIDM